MATITATAQRGAATSRGRQMLNKVPEVTLYFWIIKVLCTTVGETAADFLNTNLNLGLTGTTYLVGGALIITLVFQFRSRKYVPGTYWFAVVLISVVGTLVTDNLVDNFGIALKTTTIIFTVALAATFAAWYASQRTLSIHTVFTTRREAFYWLAILFTFALGTAAGDLVAEGFGLGYWISALMFGALIAVVGVSHFRFRLNAVLAFWIAYILTRPLGASIGDYLSQPGHNGGVGLGTVGTSALFLVTILGLVIYLTITRKDAPATETVVVDPLASRPVLERLRAEDPLAGLSEREREILALMAEGRSNHGIAKRLALAEHAVETHIRSVFEKQGLPDTPHHHRRVLAVLAYLRAHTRGSESVLEGAGG